jgi:glycosyltransferase involved in cell wall biosynthesis
VNPASLDPEQLNAWQQEGVVEYRGWVSDVRPLLAQASVFVLPSYREGTPRTVLEAMATGRPVITTDVPGCRETVRDGENGFLVPARNAEAIAHSMERFILQPELISKMGRRSRQIAEEKYDVRKVNEVILRIMGLIRAP